MSARIGAPLDTAVPADQAFSRGISQTWEVPERPGIRRRPLRRPLAPALAVLGAPALVITALVAFGAVADRGEAGLGSLPAAGGLQGSAVPAPTPDPDPANQVRGKERSKLVSRPSAREQGRGRPQSGPPGPCAQPSSPAASCRDGKSPGGGFTKVPAQPKPTAQPRPAAPGEPGSLSTGSTGGVSSGGSTSGSGTGSGSDGSGDGGNANTSNPTYSSD